MPVLIDCLKDTTVDETIDKSIDTSRYASAKIIDKICERYYSTLTDEMIAPMVEGLSVALEDSSSGLYTSLICSKVCEALIHFAASCPKDPERDTNALTPFMPIVLKKLFVTAQRENDVAYNGNRHIYIPYLHLISTRHNEEY